MRSLPEWRGSRTGRIRDLTGAAASPVAVASPPVLAFLGFDTASLPVIERMLDAGRLPTLAGLRERGMWSAFERPGMQVEAGAYQTLYSGMHLGDHGLYFPFQWSAVEQRLRYIHSFSAPPALWERVARAGGRPLVVDPYEARLPARPGGVHLSGWQFANRFVLPPYAAPRRVRRHLVRRFGRPRLVEEVFGRPSLSGLRELRRRLIDAPGRAASAVTELLAGDRFDLLWVNLPAPHVAGHRLWDVSQLAGVGAEAQGDLGDAVAEVYDAADAAIGRILSALPPDADAIVFSPSGMGPNTSRADLLPQMLDAILGTGRDGKQDASAGSAIWRLRGTVPTKLRAGVARALPSRVLLELSARLELSGADWSRTRAFPLPSDGTGYVRLNLRGRERDGIVDPADADALMDEIAAGLETFVDPDGSPAVVGVERTAKLVGNAAQADRLPDLVVDWSDRPSAALAGVTSPVYGDLVRRGGGTGRTGHHTPDAWALIAPGRSTPRETSRPPHIVDLAATACALAGADAGELPGETLFDFP
jgi:predicted AlkP superfamily phosphohydrolase/phosphomutase